MPRVAGHTPEEQYDLGEHFAEVVSQVLALAVDDAVTTMRSRAITAAAAFVSPDDASGFKSRWSYEVDNTLGPYVYQVYESGALAVAYDAAAAYDLKPGEGIPTLDPMHAHEYVAQAKNMLRGIGDDTWANLRQQIQLGVQNGESIDEIATRVYSNAAVSHARAKAVARTEVNRASNAASFAQARFVGGTNATKEWLAIIDGRTRLDHAHADGQVVDIHAPFLLGGWQLQFPGDPNAPAGETVNCRCTLTFDFPEEPAAVCSLQAAAPTLGTCVSATGLTQPEVLSASHLTSGDNLALYNAFMSEAKISPAYGGAKIYKNLQGVKQAVAGNPDYADLNEWQILAAVDKQYKLSGGGTNKTTFTEKFDEWVDSAAGKKATGGLSKHALQEAVAPTPTPTVEHILHPTASAVSEQTKSTLYAQWKEMKPITPGWGGSAIHKQLQELRKDLGTVLPETANLSDEELLKILDEQFAAKSKSSGTKTYVDEVAKWKATPAGKKQLAKEVGAPASSAHAPAPPPVTHHTNVPAPPPPAPTPAPAPVTSPLIANSLADVDPILKSKVIGELGATGSITPLASPQAIYQVLQKHHFEAKYEFTDAQYLQMLDEHTAKVTGQPNQHLYEKKITAWLQTPEGATKATQLKNLYALPSATPKQNPTTFKPQTGPTHVAPRITHIDSEGDHVYREISPGHAQTLQDAQRPWTSTESNALNYYTGSSYVEINGYLRGTKEGQLATAYDKAVAQHIQSAMHASTEPMLLYRGTKHNQFGFSAHRVDMYDMQSLVGKTFEDKGFMSTTVSSHSTFSGDVTLHIEAPPGTMMAYVSSVSEIYGEDEMLLAAGTKYKVTKVEPGGNGFRVTVRIVP